MADVGLSPRESSMKYAIWGLIGLASASCASGTDLRFECGSMRDLPTDTSVSGSTDIEQEMFRVEYRSPSGSMRLTLNEAQVKRQEQAHLPSPERQGTGLFEGKVLASDISGRIWSFTTREFPDGTVEYVYDSNRKVLVRTLVTYAYARGKDAPPETGKTSIQIYVYQCSVTPA